VSLDFCRVVAVAWGEDVGEELAGDGYAGYTHLTDVEHAWCGAHLLRDLRGIHEADPTGQLWAQAMADTLLEAHRTATAARNAGGDALSEN
jgi:transposase